MATMSADWAYDRHKKGKFFTLEHPARSLALHLDSWVRLLSCEGVRVVLYTTCMFKGSRRKKQQVLICNHPSFLRMGKKCNGGTLCDRTGQKHLKWRPTVAGGKVVQFTTGDEREYVEGFCREYASCMIDIPRLNSFVGVFSGPNAPLTAAVCERLGVDMPGTRLATEKGVRMELQRLSHLTDCSSLLPERDPKTEQNTSTDRQSHSLQPAVKRVEPESSWNRRSSLETGRQPSFGKREQLIPDGIHSPQKHLAKALELDHPFNTLATLKEDHCNSLKQWSTTPKVDNLRRLRTLGEWRDLSMSKDVLTQQKGHEALACENAKRLGRKPRTALMERLQSRYQVEDTQVPRLCLTGLPIVGDESAFFESKEVPATITLFELLATARRRRRDCLKRVEYMASKAPEGQSEAIYRKTLKEVASGTMAGPWTEQQLEERYGSHFNVIPSFGLTQGVNEKGEPKHRRIDDHT